MNRVIGTDFPFFMENCKELLENLEKETNAFSAETHDVTVDDGPWYKIFLAARTLWTDYYSVSLCNGGFTTTERTKVTAALTRAAEIMPADVNPAYVDQIRGGIGIILRIPTTLHEIEMEVGEDDEDNY